MTVLIIEQISAREAAEISHMCFLNPLPMQAFAFIGFWLYRLNAMFLRQNSITSYYAPITVCTRRYVRLQFTLIQLYVKARMIQDSQNVFPVASWSTNISSPSKPLYHIRRQVTTRTICHKNWIYEVKRLSMVYFK